MPTQNTALNVFLEDLAQMLDVGDRFVRATADDKFGHSSVYVRFVNLPKAVVERREGGGAEAENNRATFVILPAKGGKVQIEELGSVFVKRLRKKTATPDKIAKYLAAHLKDIVTDVEPRFTHTRF